MPTGPEKWKLDPGEVLVAEARVQPPGRIEAQAAGNGFDLCLTNLRLLISKRKAIRNKNRASIVDFIPVADIVAIRTEKRHPAATLGIPLYRFEVSTKNGEEGLVCEAGSFLVARLEGLANRLIELRPELASQPWPESPTDMTAASDLPQGELDEEQKRQLVQAKRILAALIAALVVVTTVGILLWRSEDRPGRSFTTSTFVLLAALWILLSVWQRWEAIRRSTRRPEVVDPSAPTVKDAKCATFWRRAVGFLIDAAGIAVLPIAAGLIYSTTTVTTTATGSSTQGGIVAMSTIAAFILYPFVFIARWNQTPGMKIMRIQLFRVSTTGSLSGVGGSRAAGRSLIAWAFTLALFFPSLIDYFWALGGENHQCLHDKWTGTMAIDIRNGRPMPAQRGANDGTFENLHA